MFYCALEELTKNPYSSESKTSSFRTASIQKVNLCSISEMDPMNPGIEGMRTNPNDDGSEPWPPIPGIYAFTPSSLRDYCLLAQKRGV
jgi:hypothetical protein